ncbi:MAG: glutamine-hydrolyzing carbamoyl-phosphate synthase small subunit, partial [Xanthomonadaceae bacterium]|nr:glutamine-hydrolyzing carbamoyl-phosphate synthase small subunit [Xanthomonadaceae bacterium]
QIVTLTYPHIGNVGVNAEDGESQRVQLAGLVLREAPRPASSWRAQLDFCEWLRQQGTVAIAGIDTRQLTRRLRESGAQSGCILAGGRPSARRAQGAAQAFRGLKNADLAREISCGEPYQWTRASWRPDTNREADAFAVSRHVVVYDFGVKRNILRMLADRGCRVTVVPAQTGVAEALALKPDGVLLSNGPGDPQPCTYAIEASREFIARRLPLFGICLGHQIVGLAAGGRTMKMKFGHHGANHPVQELASGRVLITSQNHGFAVDETTLPARVRVTHRSLFDGSNQGIEVTDAPAFSFQGHPEASPGPHDVSGLFDRFIKTMVSTKDAKAAKGA